MEIAVNERMKSQLEKIEKYAEIKEQKRLQDLQSERVEKISPYVEDASMLKLYEMDEDVWEAYFNTKRDNWLAEQERLKQIEEERIAKEKAEAEERERIRLENERLKKEAEERERLAKIEAEKKEAERLAALAPEKEKIQNWIDSINLPELDKTGFSINGISVTNVISEKFEAFKKWAESQKDSII